MNLQNIEPIANEACFSTDPQTKFQAEQIFMDFAFNLHVSQYPQIMENFSQTVLFVFLSYLDKKIPKSTDLIDIFTQLKTFAQMWAQKNGQFKRTYQQQYLKPYVSNTLGMVLGKCMKYIFLNEKIKKDLIEYFKTETNSLFKLFLYKNFIEVVSTIDNEVEYVSYRTLIYSFQQKMIPIFLQQLYPWFILVTDTIKINQLTSMMPILSQQKINHHFELFKPEEKIIQQLIFTLLREIVSFKYNITFSEYDLELDLDHCMVSFPESIVTHLTSKEFLQAFYFMLQKMVLMNYTGPYFDISFECLRKILMTKNAQLEKQQKILLAQLHYTGLFKLVQVSINSQKLITQVFQCLYKFIHAFQFTDLQNGHINHLQLVSLIKNKALIIIQRTQLTNQNQLFHSTCNLIVKIANESIAMSQQKHVSFYHQLCRDFFRSFFDSYISKDYNIAGTAKIQKISSLVQIMKQFYTNISRIGTMDMGFMFNVILSRCQEIFLSNNPMKIANLLFLMSYITDSQFYDRSLTYDATPQKDLEILGNLIHKCFEFIDFYKKSNSSDKLIDIAILLFFQKILSQCLESLGNNDEQIQILSKTYQIINSYKQIPTADQNFLLFCFNQLGLSLNTEDYQKVQHVLQSFNTLLCKLKWGIKRQYFTQSKISKQILQKTIQLSKHSLQSTPALLKQRRQLYKIITILSFDDLLDSYRTNIDCVIESLSADFKSKHYSKIIFDLSGICENVDAPIIYKYFLNKINEAIGIQLLLKTVYQQFGNDLHMLQQVVYLNRSFLTDKSLRMSSKQLSIDVYQIIEYSLPYLSIILETACNETWNDVLNEVLDFSNIFFEAGYVNLYLIKRKCKDKFINFLYKLIDSIIRNHSWAQHYPELSKSMYQNLRLFFTSGSQVIFSWEQRSTIQQQFMSKFIQLIQCTMFFNIKTLQQAAQNGKNYTICEKLLQTISKLYSFMRYKRNSIHRKQLIQNIEKVALQNQLNSINFMQSLYKLSMTNIKNFSTVLNALCVCIMELSYFYPSCYKDIFISLGITQDKIGKFERIYRKIQQSQDDILFVINLREWLSKSENNDESQIQY